MTLQIIIYPTNYYPTNYYYLPLVLALLFSSPSPSRTSILTLSYPLHLTGTASYLPLPLPPNNYSDSNPHIIIIVQAQPDIFAMLIQAAGTLRDISSSSCAVIVTLLHDLCRKVQQPPSASPSRPPSRPPSQSQSTQQPPQIPSRESPPSPPSLESSLAPLRPLWGPPLAALLCSPDMKTRTNVADYLVPELLKVDGTSGLYLLDVLRTKCGRAGG